MRRTTRSKYYGRTEVAGILNSMEVNFDRVVMSLVHHKLGGKRLQAKSRKIQRDIFRLRSEIVELPVTPDEKLLAKVKRSKAKGGGVNNWAFLEKPV